MSITVGDRLPEGTFTRMTESGPGPVSTNDVFEGKKVVLFGVPGAFTPACHKTHLPGYVEQYDAIKAKGVDTVACTAVNDVHVMNAWARSSGADGKILMLADGNGSFAKAVGLEFDLTANHMGHRSKRYSMVVDDGVVKALNVEDKPGVNVSGADTILKQL
jgi:glutaredoxin/glutathione-dependent peroxiredoxin